MLQNYPDWIRRSLLVGDMPPRRFQYYLCIRAKSEHERRSLLVLDWYGPLGWNRIGHGSYGGFAELPERGWINGARAPEHEHPVLTLVTEPVRGLHFHVDKGLYFGICEFEGRQREWRVRASAPIPGLSRREYVRVGEAKIIWLPLPVLEACQ